MKRSIHVFSILVLAGAAWACSGDDDDDTSGSSTGGSAGSSEGNDETGGSSTGGSSTGGSSTGGVQSEGGTATAGEGGAAPGPGSDITNTTNQWLNGTDINVPLAQGAYSYGDGTTTFDLTSPGSNQVCLAGLGADAGSDWANYGAAIGLLLAQEDNGTLISAFDAEAQGIVGVEFTLTSPPSSGVRLQMSMADSTEYQYQDYSFVYQGSYTGDFKTAGTYTVYFTDILMPEWGIADLVGDPIDPSSLHSLQFQMVTVQGTETPYDFCVTDIAWVTGGPGAGGAGGGAPIAEAGAGGAAPAGQGGAGGAS